MHRGESSQAGAGSALAERLGWALFIICARGCYMDFPIASLKVWLLPPATLSQFHLFVDKCDGKLLGYMTWAWFSEETERRWKAGTMDTIHLSEWNEGSRLWIIDFVTLPGYTEVCIKQAPSVFPTGTVAYTLARRALDETVATISWEKDENRRRLLCRRQFSAIN